MKRVRHRDKLYKRMVRNREYAERLEKYGKSWADFIKKYKNKKRCISEEKQR